MNYYMQQFCDYSFIHDIRGYIAQGGLESYVLIPCWVLSGTDQSALWENPGGVQMMSELVNLTTDGTCTMCCP